MPTDATTDVSSAFRMSLPFAFGTVAAIVLAAIVFKIKEIEIKPSTD